MGCATICADRHGNADADTVVHPNTEPDFNATGVGYADSEPHSDSSTQPDTDTHANTASDWAAYA